VAKLRPFVGVRYDPAVVGDLGRVVAPPYDIISPSAQQALYARSPYNAVRLELASAESADSADDGRYARAAATYRDWRKAGVLRADSPAGFYLYEEGFVDGDRSVTRQSLLAAVQLARWDENVILPHEHTMPGAKADRLKLLTATQAQFSPLLVMYDDPGDVRASLAAVAAAAPLVQFTLVPDAVAAAATSHRLWGITEPALLARLVDAFASVPLYIADGHHRYETALVFRDARRAAGAPVGSAADYALMALVETGDPGLLLRPTHRWLCGLGPLDSEAVLARLARTFELTRWPVDDRDATALHRVVQRASAVVPDRLSFVALGLAPGWCYRLTLRPDTDLANELPDVPAAIRDLDTLVLQRLIFERVFGLAAPEDEAGERIHYTRSPDEALAAYAARTAQVVFLLNPTPIRQVRAAIRSDARMPQKTTYFYPKPVTGMVFYDHRENEAR
jgi:uncharacterized protein (DUF1015 family)